MGKCTKLYCKASESNMRMGTKDTLYNAYTTSPWDNHKNTCNRTSCMKNDGGPMMSDI